MHEEEFDFENRIVSTSFSAEDADVDISLRPKTLDDYIGQDKVKENLKVYIDAAKLRGESLDHVLLYGPPGLGKTTLSNIIASEMGVNIRVTSGPAIEKQGDLAALLTNLNEGDVLFIDEIHRLSRQVEEILYPAMEDFALDIIIGKGPSARSIRIDLPRFTLIGATTRAGQLTTPLRDRFGVVLKLDLYTSDQLATIVTRSAGILGIDITEQGAYEIASRSRGTPRIANRLLKRVRDFAQVKGKGEIDNEIAQFVLCLVYADTNRFFTAEKSFYILVDCEVSLVRARITLLVVDIRRVIYTVFQKSVGAFRNSDAEVKRLKIACGASGARTGIAISLRHYLNVVLACPSAFHS